METAPVEDLRVKNLTTWVSQVCNIVHPALIPVSGDASFRRYFRCKHLNQSYIAVDAPPEKENSSTFVNVTKLLRTHDIRVPRLLHCNLSKGFLLLEDFGDNLLLDQLNTQTVNHHYTQAMGTLLQLQSVSDKTLPTYDESLLRQELQLFTDWYIGTHLQISLTDSQQQALKQTHDFLIESALQQPQVFVHRDFHSRNLMCLQDQTLGTIDYQDAVIGPLTYDLVSLLRDCYISWPNEQVYAWTNWFRTRLSIDIPEAQLNRWFDLMGLQRHLKAVGIFSRLHHRDNKSCYLNDIPRTMQYITQVSEKYSALQPFHELVTQQLHTATVS